jgi:hypothetical protein
MQKFISLVFGLALAAFGLTQSAEAARGGGGHGGGFHGGGFRGGSFHGGFRGGFRGGFHSGFGFGIYSCSPFLGWPFDYSLPCGYYPYPGDFYSFPEDGGAYPAVPAGLPRGAYWYYCDDPRGYYPHVTSCAGPWRPIPAAPPPPPG